jgi:membrane-associated phospholipid phosphatase
MSTTTSSRLRRAADRVFLLRPEEAIALLFLVPTAYLTLAAERFAREAGVLGARYPGGVLRLWVTIGLSSVLAVAVGLWPRARAARAARDALPFLACVLIYTNLHDTIGFVNPHDVHDQLIEIDRALFGVQPSIWAERFVNRDLTEVMSFFYASFFWIAPSTSLLLLARGRREEFRAVTLGIVLCFYLGYGLYVAFPAAPPRLTLALEYQRDLVGYPNRLYRMTQFAFDLLPVDSRAAFPSLHAAVSSLAAYYAWRYLRPWFWVLAPCVLGLWLSTLYLRHHYAVDLLAGWALAPIAAGLAPRLDAWWKTRAARRE